MSTMTEPLNQHQLRVAREEAEKVLARPEQDPRGWMRHEMARTILSLLDMIQSPSEQRIAEIPQAPPDKGWSEIKTSEQVYAETDRLYPQEKPKP